MVKYIANAIGIAAVIVYLLSYQQKTQKKIAAFNMTCRGLYVTQYVLLGAFSGAVLDILCMIALLPAQRKEKAWVQKYKVWIIIASALALIVAGLLLDKSVFGLLAIVACLLQMIAFWMNSEKMIRLVCLIACPCWLAYNLASGAYGSCIGDILSFMSIVIALFRYDFKKVK
ncbi:MAG: YgjV family protein [Clostridia bacterium]|nr:YgjV family protein [Clostridia bacterium]